MWSSRARRCAALLRATCISAVLLQARSAMGCAPCSSGDATLAAVGTEQPFAGRIRSALSLAYRTETIGEPGVNGVHLTEYRGDLSLIWAPTEQLILLLLVPVLERRSTDVSLLERRTRALGDVELRGKLTLLRDRAFAPRHVLAVVAGLELPSAPFQTDERGQALPPEAQTGTESLDAVTGLTYTAAFSPWTAYFSADVRFPLATRVEFQPGVSLRGTAALQRSLTPWLSLRAASDWRRDEKSVEFTEPVADSGGAVGFAGFDTLFDVGRDVTLLLGARLPVLMAKNGNQSEGWTASVGLARDW